MQNCQLRCKMINLDTLKKMQNLIKRRKFTKRCEKLQKDAKVKKVAKFENRHKIFKP